MSMHASLRTVPRQSGDGVAANGADKTTSINLRIGSIVCPHCAPMIEKALSEVSGVAAVSVNLASKSARIEYGPTLAKVADILKAIRTSGYTAGTATMGVPIKNMHCSSCVIRVELALQMTPGVVTCPRQSRTDAVDIEYQPELPISKRSGNQSNLRAIGLPSRKSSPQAKCAIRPKRRTSGNVAL